LEETGDPEGVRSLWKGVELVSTILGLDVHITNKHNKQ
jgi:hypothetical protein